MRIDLEEIAGILARRRQVNAADLKDVELYEGGERVAIPAGAIERFRLTGLSNFDFFSLRYWDPEPPKALP